MGRLRYPQLGTRSNTHQMVVLGGGRFVMRKVPLHRFLMSEVPMYLFLESEVLLRAYGSAFSYELGTTPLHRTLAVAIYMDLCEGP